MDPGTSRLVDPSGRFREPSLPGPGNPYAVEVAGVGGCGEQGEVAGGVGGPRSDLGGSVRGEVVHHEVDVHLGGVAPATDSPLRSPGPTARRGDGRRPTSEAPMS